jgi:hypothetical protein
MARSNVRRVRRAVALFVAVLLAPAGCGFVNSGERGSSKPDGFTLRGYVSVGANPAASATAASASASGDPAGGASGGPGSDPAGGASGAASGGSCAAPAAASDVHAGGAVRVADPAGHTLAAGELSPGVRDTASGRCNFGFQIAGVPGGVDHYVIGVGNRPAVSFPAHDLRSDKPAVIVVDI